MNEISPSRTPLGASDFNVFLTGATGMIGSHLLLALLEKGYAVKALYRHESSLEKPLRLMRLYGKEHLGDQVQWIRGNMNEPEEWEDELNNVDAVIHAAAKVSFLATDRKEMMQTNFKGTAALVNALLDHPGIYLLHISSIAALGGTGKNINEKAIWTPSAAHSYYAMSKYLAEMEVWRGMQEGLQAGIINPSVVVGPPADGCRWQSGFGKIIRDMDKGKIRYTFPGTTGYVAVEDVVDISLRMLEEKIAGERFIVSAGNTDFQTVLGWIAEALGTKPPQKTISQKILKTGLLAARWWHRITRTGKAYDPAVLNALYDTDTYDNSKAKERFNFTFRPLRQRIHQTVADYRKATALSERSNR